MTVAAATNVEMMPSVLRSGVEGVRKTWKPLELKGKILRLLIGKAPLSIIEWLTASQINMAAEALMSRALWFDGARDWLERDSAPCDGEMLQTAKQVQQLVAQIREAQAPTMAILRLSQVHQSAFSSQFQTAVRHFEGASQQLLIALAEMHQVMVEHCVRDGLLAKSAVVTLVGPPSLAETFRRIDEGVRNLRESRLGTTRFDAELLAEARQTLESTRAH